MPLRKLSLDRKSSKVKSRGRSILQYARSTPYYNRAMDKTITIRIDSQKDKALARHAKQYGKSKSGLIRELIDRALAPDSLERRVGHLAGSIELPVPKSPLQRRLKERNWRD